MEMANKTRPGTHPWEAPLSQPSELCPSSALSPPHCPLICPYVDAVADGAQRRAEVTAPHPPLPQPPAGHGIADGSRLVQCDFPLVAGCNPCWLLLITFFSPSCLGMASRMSCSISRGGDEADRLEVPGPLLPFLETGLTPALLQPAGISLTLQEPSKMTAAQQSPLQLPRHSWFVLLGPEGLCALILPGPSPARPSSPSPALLSPLYFHALGFLRGKNKTGERALPWKTELRKEKTQLGSAGWFCPEKKVQSHIQGFARHPGQ